MFHFLLNNAAEEVVYPDDALFIQDGNALFHVLKNLSLTFDAICLLMLDQMVGKKNYVYSTDSSHTDSIKAQERLQMGVSQ